MSVYQVEEFYICTTGLNLSDTQEAAIKAHLSDEGYSRYEFMEGGQMVVDGIPSEHEGETLETKIYELAGV
ncbi:MAG: hypothetical protein JKY50_22535 [Oleispira sp.]|nr:hypothetical protein [Oleispira sp.]